MFIPYGDIKRAMYESLAKRDVFDDANNDAHKVISFGQCMLIYLIEFAIWF